MIAALLLACVSAPSPATTPDTVPEEECECCTLLVDGDEPRTYRGRYPLLDDDGDGPAGRTAECEPCPCPPPGVANED